MIRYSDFVAMVRHMRRAQRDYYSRRDKDTLLRAKSVERDVDRILSEETAPEEGLFDITEGDYRCAVIEYRTSEDGPWLMHRVFDEGMWNYIYEDGISRVVRDLKMKRPSYDWRYRYGFIRFPNDGGGGRTL